MAKKSGTRTHSLAKVVDLSKHIITEYFKGNLTPWFTCLYPESVFVSPGQPTLFSSKEIESHMEDSIEQVRAKLYRDDYSFIPINSKTAIVLAETVTGKPDFTEDNGARTSTTFTFVFHASGSEVRLVYQHLSYEHNREADYIPTQILPMDLQTFRFAKHLLMDHPHPYRICIPNGSQTIYLDPDHLLYVRSQGHNTKLYCLDKVIPCSKSITYLRSILPEHFYSIHRSYIINIHYLVSIRNYEATLISDVKIPIPALTYQQAKSDIEQLLKNAPTPPKKKIEQEE